MENSGKLLLTEEIAWRDLMLQKAGYRQLAPILGMTALAISAVALTANGLVRLFNGQSGGEVMLVLALAAVLGIKLLHRCVKRIEANHVNRPMDVEDLFFDMDRCINKYEEKDSDGDTFHYMTFQKAGRVGAGKDGFPLYDRTSIGDEFFTVSLKSNPRRVRYYPCKAWWLGEPEEDAEDTD